MYLLALSRKSLQFGGERWGMLYVVGCFCAEFSAIEIERDVTYINIYYELNRHLFNCVFLFVC